MMNNYEKYCQDHAVETQGKCALLSWGICTCDDGAAKKAFEEAFAPKLMEYLKPPPPPEVAPLPTEIVEKFDPFVSMYEMTLTINTDDIYTLREWFTKIVKSKIYSVKGYIACIELQKCGNPHIHALIFSKNKYCDGTKIKKLKFPWRYTMARVRMPDNFYVYLNKERDNAQVIEYCLAKGVPQIWEEVFK